MLRLYSCSLLLLGYLFTLNAQVFTSSEVKIKDQLGNSNILIDCDYEFDDLHGITLKVEYPEIKNTTDYSVSKINYDSSLLDFEGKDIVIKNPDYWSDVVNLPFAFCFYGASFSSIVISDNGVISFDTTLANKIAPYNIAGSIKSGNLSSYTIFGLYHDLVNNYSVKNPLVCEGGDCGTITTYTQGEAPFRRQIISYNNVNHFNCSYSKSTFQIILYETTNIVEVHVKSKPKSCFDRPSIIGITNEDGIGISPEGRDDGIWMIEKEEAWRFLPEIEYKPIVSWYNAKGEKVGVGDIYKIGNIENTIYSAEVVYICGATTTLKNSISINIALDYPQAKELNVDECMGMNDIDRIVNFEKLIPQSVSDMSNLKFYFYRTRAAALSKDNQYKEINPKEVEIKYTKSNESFLTLYLRVEKESNEECFSVVPITVYLRKSPEYKEIETVQHCVPYGSGEHTRNINVIMKQYIENLDEEFSIKFYNTEEDAINDRSPINNIEFTQVPTVISLYAKIFNKYTDICDYNILKLSVKINYIVFIADFEISICDPLKQFRANIREYPQRLSFYSDFNFYYYRNQQDAINGTDNYLSDKELDDLIVNLGETFYVRFENKNDIGELCPGEVFKIKFIFAENNFEVGDFTVCTDKDVEYIDLIDYIDSLLKSYPNVKILGLYLDRDKKNKIPDDLLSKYPVKTDNSFKFYVDFIECEQDIKEAIISFVEPKDVQSLYEVCDIGMDGVEMLQLKDIREIINKTYDSPTIKFFDDKGNELIEEVSINKENIFDLYVHVTEKGLTCSFIHKIEIKLIDYIFIETQSATINICDNNLDNVEEISFKNYNENLVKDKAQLLKQTFRYYISYEDAYKNNNSLSGERYILIKDNDTEEFPIIYVRIQGDGPCFNIEQLKFININTLEVEDFTEDICDINSDMFAGGIDLSSYLSFMTKIPISDLDVTYYITAAAANQKSNDPDLKIIDYKNFAIRSVTTFVWIRFESKATNCYVIKKIRFNLIPLPKSVPVVHMLCDDDLDGIYTIDLKDLESEIIDDPENHIFEYYYDEEGKNKLPSTIYQTNFLTTDSFLTLYVKLTNKYGCITEAPLSPIHLYTQEVLSINNDAGFEILECDDDFDGIGTFNLSNINNKLTEVEDAQFTYYSKLEDALKGNLNSSSRIITFSAYRNLTPNEDIVYVRITSSLYCPNVTSVKLNVLPVPISKISEKMLICPGETLQLNATTDNENDKYLWNTAETSSSIIINKAGKYWVTITNQNNCSYTYSIQVDEYPKVEIEKLIAGKDRIQVIASGPAPLEYSIDRGKTWTSNNTFTGLLPGVYTFYVRSLSIPCQPILESTVLFDIKNVITPNGDKKNDFWKLCDLEYFRESSQIKIFNRYGKIVFEETSKSCFVWDGYYLGRLLPTSSYWYVINIPDGRILTGWILLKNYYGLGFERK